MYFGRNLVPRLFITRGRFDVKIWLHLSLNVYQVGHYMLIGHLLVTTAR